MAGSISEDFRDELTCPICINVYEQPLRLPCGHSYCRSCVVNMVKPIPIREARYPGERQLSCPECRQLYPIPAQGVDAVFRPDFKLARLVEVLDRVEKRASQQTLDTVSSLPDLRATPDRTEEEPISFYDNVGEGGLPQSLPEHLPPFPVADTGNQTAPGNHSNGHQGNATPSEEERDGTRRKVIVSPRPTPERDVGSDRTVSGDENTGENRISVSGDARKDAVARSEPPDMLEDEVASPDDWTSNAAYASPQLRRWQRGSGDSAGQVGQRDREGSALRHEGHAEQTASSRSSRAATPIRGSNSSAPVAIVQSQSSAREQTSQVRIERLLTPDLSLPSDPAISGISALSSDESTLVPEESSIVENPSSQRVGTGSAAQGTQAGPDNKAVGQLPATPGGGARIQTSGNRVERPTTLAVEPRTNPLRALPPTAPARGSTRELNVQASQTASTAVEPQGATASQPESGAEASSSAEGSSEGSLNPGHGKRSSEPHGSSASPEGSRSQSSRSSKLSFGMKVKKFFSSLLSLDSSDDDDEEDSVAPSSSDSAQPRRKKESSSSMSSYDNDRDERLSSSSSSDLEETRRKYLFDEDSDSD